MSLFLASIRCVANKHLNVGGIAFSLEFLATRGGTLSLIRLTSLFLQVHGICEHGVQTMLDVGFVFGFLGTLKPADAKPALERLPAASYARCHSSPVGGMAFRLSLKGFKGLRPGELQLQREIVQTSPNTKS